MQSDVLTHCEASGGRNGRKRGQTVKEPGLYTARKRLLVSVLLAVSSQHMPSNALKWPRPISQGLPPGVGPYPALAGSYLSRFSQIKVLLSLPPIVGVLG